MSVPHQPSAELPPGDAPLLYPEAALAEPPASRPPRRSVATPVATAVGALVIVAAVVFVLVQRSGAPAPAAAATTSVSVPYIPTGTPSPTPAAPAFTPYAGDLADLILPMPAGADPVTLSILTPGMSDAEQAAALLSEEGHEYAMVKNLKDLGLIDGKVVVWQQANDIVAIDLLRFGAPTAAQQWFWMAKQLTTSSNIVGQGSLPTATTNSWWFEASAGGVHELTGIVALGQFGINVRTGNGTDSTNRDLLKQLVMQQYQRLPGA